MAKSMRKYGEHLAKSINKRTPNPRQIHFNLFQIVKNVILVGFGGSLVTKSALGRHPEFELQGFWNQKSMKMHEQ